MSPPSSSFDVQHVEHFTIAKNIFELNFLLKLLQVVCLFLCVCFIIRREQSVLFEIARASVVGIFVKLRTDRKKNSIGTIKKRRLFAEKGKFLLNCSKLQLNCQSGNSLVVEREKEGGMCIGSSRRIREIATTRER